jgi:cation/acetate symporter
MNKQGAISGMVIGLIFSLGYIIYFKFLDGNPEHYLFGISPQGIGLPGVILSTLTTLVVSKFFPPASTEIQRMVEDIRYPE